MNMNKCKGLLLAISAAWIMGATSAAPASAETVVNLGGSGFGLGVMKLLAESYTKSHPDVRIVIAPSLGSSGGIKALLNGFMDIAVSARPLKDAEQINGAKGELFAKTPLVFIVNSKVKKQEVTTAELQELYGDKKQTWPDGSRVRVVLRPEEDIDTKIVRGISPAMDQAVNFAMAREGKILAVTDQEATDAVTKVAGSLGEGALTQILAEKVNVTVLSFNGVKPSIAALSDGTYPLAKALYLVTAAKTGPAAHRFIEFIRSPAGRKILAEYGNLTVEQK